MRKVNSDKAYDHIRKRILTGAYPLGQTLATRTLSTEIGVNRIAVRDALRQLEADGLVTIETHLGARVRKMDLKEFGEICMVRLALESFVSGLAAAHRTEEDLREISQALEAMRRFTQQIAATPLPQHER